MKKFMRTVALTLLVVLSLQQAVFADDTSSTGPKTSKPTEGVEALDPNYGTSQETNKGLVSPMYTEFNSYYSTIYNTGYSLYCEGDTTAGVIADEVKVTVYVQRWNGTAWDDLQSWSKTEYNDITAIMGGHYYGYQSGYYYRTRSVHTVIKTQTETRNSSSAYIYID